MTIADIRLRQRLSGERQDIREIPVEHERAAIRQFGQVAMLRIIWRVALEEHDPMPIPKQRADEGAPQRAVAVSPGGADGQAEDHDAHRLSQSSRLCIRALSMTTGAAAHRPVND